MGEKQRFDATAWAAGIMGCTREEARDRIEVVEVKEVRREVKRVSGDMDPIARAKGYENGGSYARIRAAARAGDRNAWRTLQQIDSCFDEYEQSVRASLAHTGLPTPPSPSVEPRTSFGRVVVALSTSFGQIVPEQMAQAQGVPLSNEAAKDNAGLGGSTRVALRDEMRAPDTAQRDDVVLTVGRA